MSTRSRTPQAAHNEATILGRLLTNCDAPLPNNLARDILNRTIGDRDKARMHELAVRDQGDDLTLAEQQEMHDSVRPATLRSIFRFKARRSLGIKLKTESAS